jgi:hypothetical protein
MLNHEQVNKVRTRYKQGDSLKAIANDMDLTYCAVQEVALNRTYHDDGYNPPKKNEKPHRNGGGNLETDAGVGILEIGG